LHCLLSQPHRRPILTLAEELSIAVGQKVDNGSGVGLGAADVLLPGLGGDEGPELLDVDGRGPLVIPEKVEV
jgi:hypothetical protein